MQRSVTIQKDPLQTAQQVVQEKLSVNLCLLANFFQSTGKHVREHKCQAE